MQIIDVAHLVPSFAGATIVVSILVVAVLVTLCLASTSRSVR